MSPYSKIHHPFLSRSASLDDGTVDKNREGPFLSRSASLSGARIDKNGDGYLVLNPPSSLISTQLTTDPMVMSSEATAAGTTPADPR